MMIPSHSYWVSYIIIFYFSLTFHGLALPTPYFCHHDQKDALLEFIDEFPNYDSMAYNLWNKSSDCCVWKGVSCDDKFGQVISINLNFTHLRGSLKTNSSLFRLQYLRHLSLVGCFFNGEIPFSLGNLSHLTFVDLSLNDLVGEIPSSLGNLNQLRSLSLEYNDLTGEIPFSLGNMSHLVELTLVNNHLVGEVPATIGNLNKLATLSFYGNTLSGNIPSLLANLTKISYVDLTYNNFTSTLPSDMSVFHDLIQETCSAL